MRSSQFTVSRLQELRDPVEEHQHQRAQRHLHGVGAADELQELVDEEGDDEDVEDVQPGEARRRANQALEAARSCRRSPRMASHIRTTSTIARTSCTRTTWAPPSTQAATAAAVPMSRSPTGRSSTRADEALARGPDQHRPVERAPARAGGAAPPGCGAASLEKPMPGSTISCARRHARRLRAPPALPQLGDHLRPSRPRSAGSRCMVAKSPRRCMSTAGTPRSATSAGQAGIEAEAADVVDEVGARRRGRRAATAALVVSTESRPAPAVAQGRDDGHHAPDLLAGVHAAAPPGPVDSPPTSTMSAPASKRARPCATAAVGLGEAAAVGERVRGHVEHTHDPGPLAEDGLRPAQGEPVRPPGGARASIAPPAARRRAAPKPRGATRRRPRRRRRAPPTTSASARAWAAAGCRRPVLPRARSCPRAAAAAARRAAGRGPRWAGPR